MKPVVRCRVLLFADKANCNVMLKPQSCPYFYKTKTNALQRIRLFFEMSSIARVSRWLECYLQV